MTFGAARLRLPMIIHDLPNSPFKDQPFDYVIVGSGAGGAPLAVRLAEAGFKVLVLEAGVDHRAAAPSKILEITRVPGLHAQSAEAPAVSCSYAVQHYIKPDTPDRNAIPSGKPGAGLIPYPRATAIGGCTMHNAMITLSGPPDDWDELAWRLGDPSWGSDVMRGYFQKIECCHYLQEPRRARTFRQRLWGNLRWLIGFDVDPSAGRHGFHGWLHTSIGNPELALNDPQLNRMCRAAAKASLREGMDRPRLLVNALLHGQIYESLDPNHFRRQMTRPEGLVAVPVAVFANTSTPTTSGRWSPQTATGHRSSAGEWLRDNASTNPALLERLVIATNCLATEILLAKAGSNWRATGVKYMHGERIYQVRPDPSCALPTRPAEHIATAQREVIVCAGAFNTPQLLLLSGIGPREQLSQMGIKCKVDSPGVGRNLHDRYEISVVTRLKHTFDVLKNVTFTINPTGPQNPALQKWEQKGTGVFASNGACVGVLKRSSPDLSQPDLFIFGVPIWFQGYRDGFSNLPPDTFNLFSWLVLKARTKNRGGRVELQSADPRVAPRIEFNYFNSGPSAPGGIDDEDLEALLNGFKFVREICRHAGDIIEQEEFPGPVLASSDDEVKRWIKSGTWGHHACGSCRMGRRTDPCAVIDGQFRVLGKVDPKQPHKRRETIDGLRIVDASIFPDIPGYFIVSNIYVASEKAADVIMHS